MARVDYFGIQEQIAAILRDDEDVRALVAEVSVEEEVVMNEMAPHVIIYLEDRQAPADMQGLRAGQATRFLLRFSIWCIAYSIEKISHAIKLRDELIGTVEVALMKERSLRGAVNKCWLEGGQMPSSRLPNNAGWFSGGEIVLVADVLSTT
jgi:hypothetical protein